MSDLNLYLYLISEDENVNIKEVKSILPSNNIKRVYSIGEKQGRHVRKVNNITYQYKFDNIKEVNVSCNFFISEWLEYYNVLKELLSTSFKSYLLFEFDIEKSNFPELVFPNNFITFLATANIQLQFYFYTCDKD